MQVINRKEAKEQGLTKYFTGNPCKHGHISERYVSNGHCSQCHLINMKNYHLSDNYKARRVALRLPEEDIDLIDQAMSRTGATKSNVIRQAIRAGIASIT